MPIQIAPTAPILTRRTGFFDIEMPRINVRHLQRFTPAKRETCDRPPRPSILYIPWVATGDVRVKWQIVGFSLDGIIDAV
jgi:hypothetical protein